LKAIVLTLFGFYCAPQRKKGTGAADSAYSDRQVFIRFSRKLKQSAAGETVFFTYRILNEDQEEVVGVSRILPNHKIPIAMVSVPYASVM